MSLKLSRRSDIESFRVLDNLRLVNELQAKGEDIVRLEAGQPCFGAPQAALDYLSKIVADDPVQGYTDAMGMALLRDRIALYYKDTYDIDIDMNRVAVTIGSSSGFIMSFLAAFDAGDKVGITLPTYAAYRNILRALNLEPVEIPVSADTNYQPTADLLKQRGGDLDGLIINSPSNPTGTMIDEAELQKIGAWCEESGVRLLSDEAYHRITYEEDAQTALKYSDNAIVLNTFSKYFAMTGWRLGWLILPPDLAGRIKKLAENLFVSPPTTSQHLAYKIFDHTDTLDKYVEIYRKNRDILMQKLPEAGLEKISDAKGAFYIYIDVSGLTDDSEAFCRRMLHEAKVATTAGVDFDPAGGHGAIRMSYAGSPEDMQEACRRIKDWL